MEVYITIRYNDYKGECSEEIDGAFSSYEAAKDFVKKKKDTEYSEMEASLKRLRETGIFDEDDVKEVWDDFLANVGWYVTKVTIDSPEIRTKICYADDEED